MDFYTKPELNITEFESEDIITTSFDLDDDETPVLKK